jgi:hypothetical protein
VAIGDIESVKKEIAAVLKNTTGAINQFGTAVFFNATLDAVNTEKADGRTTPYPAEIWEYEKAALGAYPAAELQALTTQYAPEDDVKIASHRIAVVWTVVGDNEATVTTDIERLVRTTRDVFWRTVLAADLGGIPMVVESEQYSALAPALGQPFMKGAQVMLIAGAIST